MYAYFCACTGDLPGRLRRFCGGINVAGVERYGQKFINLVEARGGICILGFEASLRDCVETSCFTNFPYRIVAAPARPRNVAPKGINARQEKVKNTKRS